MAGKVGQGAKIYANRLTLSGVIEGDAQLYAQEIEFLPGARITGNLMYASRTPLAPDPAAQAQGTITREPMTDDEQHAGRRAADAMKQLQQLGFGRQMLFLALVLNMRANSDAWPTSQKKAQHVGWAFFGTAAGAGAYRLMRGR